MITIKLGIIIIFSQHFLINSSKTFTYAGNYFSNNYIATSCVMIDEQNLDIFSAQQLNHFLLTSLFESEKL